MSAATTTRGRPWLKPDGRPLTSMLVTNFISLISNTLTGLAVPWFVLELTGSAAKMGLTAAATMLPSVIMLFIGGAIADRTSPRHLSVFSDVVSGVTVAMVPLLYLMDLLTFPILLALMVAGAVFDTPGYSARTKLLPQLANRAGVPIERVTSLQGVFQAVSMLFGAVLAGVLISVLGATNVLWFNAAAFALSAGAIWLMVPNLHTPREDMPSVIEDVLKGFTYVAHHPVLRPLMFGALVLNGLLAPITAVLMPYMAKIEWDSATAFGLLISGFGAGALLGSIAMGTMSDRLPRSLVLRISLVLLSFPILILAATTSLPIAWIATFLIGLGMGMVNPMLQAMMFRTTDPEMLGRVNGVIGAGSQIAVPLGVMVATPILTSLGLSWTYGLIAATLIAMAVVLMRSPMMTHIDAQSDMSSTDTDPIGATTYLTNETRPGA